MRPIVELRQKVSAEKRRDDISAGEGVAKREVSKRGCGEEEGDIPTDQRR